MYALLEHLLDVTVSVRTMVHAEAIRQLQRYSSNKTFVILQPPQAACGPTSNVNMETQPKLVTVNENSDESPVKVDIL